MTSERWHQITEIFQAARVHDQTTRAAYLDQACRNDPSLRAEVEQLLAGEKDAEAFFDAPLSASSAASRWSAGAQIGVYRIEGRVGAGGMGEVYRGRDTRLGRDVAIKVLPPEMVADPERRTRLEREARLLAALNHPHIGAIYGLEEHDGLIALVLEFVEGPTLADRLRRGPIPPGEAVGIAREIAEAIEAAHDKGIIHRDLKPANVKLAPVSGVKVLDFGLAKALAGVPDADASQLPTVTADGTRAGQVMGTAAYMSPEQARGLVVDKRTDIWAFGCVLYEMLAGRRAFEGKTLSDTLVAVLEREPDWSALPDTTSPRLRWLLRRCLEKDARRRWRDIGDAALELTSDVDAGAGTSEDAVPPRNRRLWTFVLPAAGLVALSSAVTTLIVRRPAPPTVVTPAVIRFAIPPPPGNRFGSKVPDVEATYLAVSPDGSQLAFVATDRAGISRLWLRPLAGLEARALNGTDNAISAFWSPDGRSLAFFADGKLKRLNLPDGTPVPLADTPVNVGLSGTWGDSGQLVFGPTQGIEILTTSTSAVAPQPVVKPDPSRHEAGVSWPWFLPDGRRFLYSARLDDGKGELRVAELGGASESLLAAVSNAQWVDPDYVVFARDGMLLAQRVDLSRARLTGEPFAIANAVDYVIAPVRAAFATSRNGTVVYQSHRDVNRLAWFGRTGTLEETLDGAGGYFDVRISPDGARVLYSSRDPRLGILDLWVRDLGKDNPTRVTTKAPQTMSGVWLPKKNEIAFSGGGGAIGSMRPFVKDLESGAERELWHEGLTLPSDVSTNGSQLLVGSRAPGGAWSILAVPVDGIGNPASLFDSPFSVFGARLSPDGQAIAFISN